MSRETANPEADAVVGWEEEYVLATDPRCYGRSDGKVIAWRVECFVGLGFDELGAMALAIRRDVDRAVVERLVKGGATHAYVEAFVL